MYFDKQSEDKQYKVAPFCILFVFVLSTIKRSVWLIGELSEPPSDKLGGEIFIY